MAVFFILKNNNIKIQDMKNKVVIITTDQEEYFTKLSAYNLPDLEIIAPLNDDDFEEAFTEANIIFWNPFRFIKHIESVKNLVWAQSTFAWIDALCKEWAKTDYILTNIKDAFGAHMSEYVFAYILMLEKWALESIEKQNKSYWKQKWYPTISWKTIVILWTGSIGKVIAKTAKAFGMKTIGYKTNIDPVEHFDEVYTIDTKKECFEQADYLVSVLPNTQSTIHTVDEEALSWMKKSSIFINIWRWLNVDEDALVQALESKKIAWAVLDVFQTEPLPEDHPFWKLENVYVTPHVSGYVEDNSRLIEIFANNYKKFHAGEPLDYVIDFKRGF